MKKIISIITITLLILASMSISVFATENQSTGMSATTELVSNVQNTKQGEEIILTFSIKNISGTNTGINSLEGVITYDSEVFEQIVQNDSETSFSPLNSWDTPTYNSSNFKFVTTKASFVKEDQDVMTIKFKVKDSAKSGSTTISIDNVKVSNIDELYEVQDPATAIIQIGESTSSIPEINDITNTNTEENNVVISNTEGTTTNNSNSNSASIPYSGTTRVIVPSIVALATIATISYIKYKKVL